jgi:hypothetical protein
VSTSGTLTGNLAKIKYATNAIGIGRAEGLRPAPRSRPTSSSMGRLLRPSARSSIPDAVKGWLNTQTYLVMDESYDEVHWAFVPSSRLNHAVSCVVFAAAFGGRPSQWCRGGLSVARGGSVGHHVTMLSDVRCSVCVALARIILIQQRHMGECHAVQLTTRTIR